MTRNDKRMTFGIPGLLLFLVCLNPSAQADDFPVAALLSLSGDCADVGELSRRGIELARDEINARGGILGRPVHVVFEDTRETNSINAVTAYQRTILNRALHYIIGPSCTPAGLALAPVAAKNPNVLLISPSIGLRQFNEAGENIFKLWPYDEDGPKLLAEYARKHGWKRAAVFSSQQTWEDAQGRFFQEAFKQIGGEIVASVNPLPNETDLRSSAMRLITSRPDVILLSNYINFENAALELRKQGYTGPQLSTLMTDEKVELAKGALDNVISYGYEPANPEFVRRFRSKFGREPWGLGADTAYDALQLYAQAIQRTGVDEPKKVQEQLLAVSGYPGASGVLSIDAKGGVTREPILMHVREKKVVPLLTGAGS